MKPRVLLTGASGFVGSHVLEALLRRDRYHVVVIASFTQNGTMDRILDVTERVGRGSLTLVAHDLTVPLSPRQLARVGDVTGIVALASRSSVDESIEDPECFVLNNVRVALTTLELGRTLGVERYLHLSTDEVYGQASSSLVARHRPSSPYAASKAAQEDLSRAWARTYGVPVTIATSANMFGPRQSTLAFVPKVVRAALSDDELVAVHVDASGRPGSRRFSYVVDVAEALVDELESGEPASHLTYPGRYHVDNLTLARDVWYLTTELAGVGRREPRIATRRATITRPGYDVSYEPLAGDAAWRDAEHAPWSKAIYDTVAWFVEHPDWLT